MEEEAPPRPDELEGWLRERRVGRRLSQLAALRASEAPHYLRVVELGAGRAGQASRRGGWSAAPVVEELGTPLVFDDHFGLAMPLDDEAAVRAGRIFRRDDWTRSGDGGSVLATEQIVSRPRSRPDGPTATRSGALGMPSRAVLMAASGGLRVALGELRRARAAASGGGDGSPPASHSRLAAAPHGLAEDYLCTGLPSPALPKPPDSSTCAAASTRQVTPFQGSRVAAINAYAYLDDGYDGAGEEGLAAWAWGEEVMDAGDGWVAVTRVPHIVVTVIENSPTKFPDPTHPAFQSALGAPRARYFIGNDGTVLSSADFGRINLLALTSGTATHGTATAGVALASVVDGQDARVVDDVDRQGRSGVARRAYAVFSADASVNTFDVLHQGYAFTHVTMLDGQVVSVESEVLQGTDIAVQSQSSNTGDASYGPAHDPTPCPDPDEARGLDTESQRVLHAYIEDAAVYVKSAGNGHMPSGSGSAVDNCPSVPYEVSSPGTSPAAIPVGSLATGGVDSGYSPAAMQRMESLNKYSEGCTTPDGRVYPALVVSHYSCGVAGSWVASDGTLSHGYVQHGMTSGAAPTVAGAAALFKHWYLEAHGPGTANQPGRVVSNLLNMADGVAFDAWSGGERTHPPAPGWGLGRFRMRRYAGGHMSRPWFRGTSAVTLTNDDPVDVVWLAGDEASEVPHGTRRLVVTLWWLEVNTGEGERKAEVGASLYAQREEGWRLVRSRDSRRDCKIRFQFDCYDAFFHSPPTGRLALVVHADRVPREQRGAGRDSRTIYVSWYWEGGPDLSLLRETSTACPDPALDLCQDVVPVAGGGAAQATCAASSEQITPQGPACECRSPAGLLDRLEGLVRAHAGAPRGAN